VAIRRGNPLHYSKTEKGFYLASLPDGLPGQPGAVRDGTACPFTRKEVQHATL
jgi:hypothetical protein